MSTEELWQQLDIALSARPTRHATLAALNRLLHKRFPHFFSDHITQGNCDVWRESLTAAQLKQCNPGHARALPKQMPGPPLVVFEHQAERYMIDGTNRLNVWLRDGDQEGHDAIIIKRKTDG